ncbi:MAG: Gfo/Idh/MocA family oxidoreductase [Caulobacteraceae bacterium]
MTTRDQQGREPALSAWAPPDPPIGCAIVGLGQRGASLARRLDALEGVDLRWFADLSSERMEAARERLSRASPQFTDDAARLLADPLVDAVFIAVPDHLHRTFAVAAFEAGKHVFLEKPLATGLEDGLAIVGAWQDSGRVLQLGYVLREAPFYRAARRVIAEGRLGAIHAIRLTDDLGVVHGASFMRRWHRHSAVSGGLMVHKGCHDLDLICWLLDSRPARVASFGGAELFARPAPAPFCSQCPERGFCPYVDTGAFEGRTPAQSADPTAFGLDICVFGGDKNIVDNQVVAFEMEGGARGSFALAMQNPHGSERTLSVLGRDGRLDGVFDRAVFEVATNDGAPVRKWSPTRGALRGHGGGDEGTVRAFLEACLGRAAPQLTDPDGALRGLVFALAAEVSRRRGVVVTLGDDLGGLR